MTTSAQTVPVPVDLLQRLMDNTTITRDVFHGDSVEVRPSGIGAIIDLKSFIPAPPKVGDTLTADDIKNANLPPRSVLVDDDGDPWITYPDGQVYLAMDGVSEHQPPLGIYGPYTLVHIGVDD